MLYNQGLYAMPIVYYMCGVQICDIRRSSICKTKFRFSEFSALRYNNNCTHHVTLYVCMLCHFSQEWTKLERPEGAPWPVERDSHAACCLNYGEEHPQLLITGGVDNNATTLQDAWILNVQSGRWSEVRMYQGFNS